MSAGDRQITAGFIPLLDAAMLIVAREKGFAAEEGIDLALVRETSWASIRDRVAIGHFDAAHMLAPMAIAGSLLLPPLPVPIVAPVTLGTGRNAITVSLPLWRKLQAHGLTGTSDAAAAVAALRKVREADPTAPPLTFAAVHTYSAHLYLLRYWLAAGGLVCGRDVVIEFLPPPFMADALASGRIDGCCVGEPWNTAGEMREAGHIVTTSGGIWPGGPDKVLGLRRDWAESNAGVTKRLVRALYRAGQWCDGPDNHRVLAELLARPEYLDTNPAWLMPGLTGPVADEACGFARHGATRPQDAHAVWFLTQMARWGQVSLSEEALTAAKATYLPGLYDEALAQTPDRPHPEPGEASCRLFDGRPFDPENPTGYVEGFEDA